MRNGDSLATVLLVSRMGGGELRPLKAPEFWKLCGQLDGRAGPVGATDPEMTGRRRATPADLLGRTVDDLVRSHGLAPELATRIVGLMGRATAVAFELERLHQSGISTLTPFEEHYPGTFVVRLGRKAPPLLYAAGALELLDRPGVGVVGSRDVSDEGARVAAAAAAVVAHFGASLVSGGARGVDQIAMDAALRANGTVIGFPADSLSGSLRNREVRRALHGGTTVMCSPYHPEAPFAAGHAAGRNKLVYAQSRFTLVVAGEAGRGGTWSGAAEALAEHFGRVAVWRAAGEGTGNRHLEQRGATPVRSFEKLDDLLHATP